MLTKELIKKLRKLEIFTRRMVNDQLAGQYHSVFKGRGMNFDEVRLYQPGDDIRHIDWNVSARTDADEVYIKTYVEERELTVLVVFDASASTLFGSVAQRKREVAAEVAALVAFSAIKNNDRVGLVIFTDEVELFIPPQKGRKHVMRIITEVLNFAPQGRGTDVQGAMEFINLVNRRKTVAFVISDFLDEGFERALSMAARRHDIIPVVITDPMEEDLPNLGICHFEDAETGEWVAVDTASGRVRARYRAEAEARRGQRERMFQRSKLDHVAVYTHQPYVQPLVGFFKRRAKRH
jgi:uncharacterized protein (DUF58 family)